MSSHRAGPPIAGMDFVGWLGSGGYADVFQYAEHNPTRNVAVKIMKTAGLTERGVARFIAEGNAMAKLEHPHIVPVFSTGTTADGRPYIVMMLYPRGTLYDRAATARMSVAEVLRIGIQIGSAVAAAHQADLLHRDIKPHNILISQWDVPGLSDFGIAASLAESDDDDLGVSIPWSPPEILYQTGQPSFASDVYSLGATLWHLLVGRGPFDLPGQDTEFALMQRVRDLPVPSTGRTDVPGSMDRLLQQTMAKEARHRPGSALELVRSLQGIETELRLAPTAPVLALDSAPGPVDRGTTTRRGVGTRSAPPDGGAGLSPAPSQPPPVAPTRLKSMQQVGSRSGGGAPDLRRPPPGAAPAEAPWAAGDRAEAATQQRAARMTSEGRTPQRSAVLVQPTPAKSSAPHRRRLILPAILVAVVVIAVVVGLLLSAGSPEPTPIASEPPSEVGDPGNQADELPPGPVTITAKRSGRKVTFRWDYSARRTDDTFLYRIDEEAPKPTAERGVTVTSKGRTCLDLKVVRADGSDAARSWSDRKCA